MCRWRRAVADLLVRSGGWSQRLLRIASPLGLYAEEFEVDRARHLGNFPQAFSHLALIEAAARILAKVRIVQASIKKLVDNNAK